MIHSMVLHYWSGSEMYLTPFWGVKVKKLPKASLNSYFLLLSKTFEITKLGNYKSCTHETWPRYVPPQHLSFTKGVRVLINRRMGVHTKNHEKCYEICEVSTFKLPNNTLLNAVKVGIFLTSSKTISL